MTMISAVMLTGEGKPALARDAMFGVAMIVLNGMIGVSLVMGGLRHHEQEYNLRGANSFLSLIVPLTVLGLVLPNFTETSIGPTLSAFHSIFLAVTSIAIYCLFLIFRTGDIATTSRSPPEWRYRRRSDGHGEWVPHLSWNIAGVVPASDRRAVRRDCIPDRPWHRSSSRSGRARRVSGRGVDLLSRVAHRNSGGVGE